MKNVAVILCGSGFKDGSEIRESVATLWALSLEKAKVQCYSPDQPQTDVVNCLTGETVKNESRNMLVESARIARGEVLALNELNPTNFEALIIPGGFGAAKNLCDFAFKGSSGRVHPELEKIIVKFNEQSKPIGAICIAPAILALALKGKSLEITLGNDCEASHEIEKLGHRHKICKASQCHVDTKNKIVSTPAYMHDSAPLHEIFAGIHQMVKAVLNFP